IANAGQILHTAAANQHDRVLVQVMPLAGAVCGYLEAVAEPHTRNFPERRIRRLRRGGVRAAPASALLRIPHQRRRLRVLLDVLATAPDELVYRGHRMWNLVVTGESVKKRKQRAESRRQ